MEEKTTPDPPDHGIRRSIGAQFDKLVFSLIQWDKRDDTKAQPEVRQAANDAVAAIDEMTRQLYRLREQVVGEMRQSDDASTARADALLAKLRREAGEA